MPELKSFLKDLEAESYRGVKVDFIHGRKAKMSIYHDGAHKEDIMLSDLKTKDEMHALFKEKGFEMMNETEIEEMKERKKREAEEEHKKMMAEQEERRKMAQEKRKKMSEEREAEIAKKAAAEDGGKEEL